MAFIICVTVFSILFVSTGYLVARDVWVVHNKTKHLASKAYKWRYGEHVENEKIRQYIIHFPSYYTMVFKYFWVWDFNYFINLTKKNEQISYWD